LQSPPARQLRCPIRARKTLIVTFTSPQTLSTSVETRALAARLAPLLRAGNVVALSGELGAGKTFLARAIIQALGGPDEVPSPTFTLVQTYDLSPAPVWHFDLYRLARPEEAYELDIEDAFIDAISLIEWPERLGALLPRDRLDIHLAYGDTPDSRVATITGGPSWTERLKASSLEDLTP
jgi:tRNA threonylcarbamoyladenosine biosynthesis protein TsaE